jgi:hypothetical protein
VREALCIPDETSKSCYWPPFLCQQHGPRIARISGVSKLEFRRTVSGISIWINPSRRSPGWASGSVELFSRHVEPGIGSVRRRSPAGGVGGPPYGAPGPGPERDELRRWRTSVSMDFFKAIRKKFDDAGVPLYCYNLSFRDDWMEDEIEAGFSMARVTCPRFLYQV